ncbi:TPA: hypothetical protein ACKP28_002768, partial [Stenotrophomonas maltophilia]
SGCLTRATGNAVSAIDFADCSGRLDAAGSEQFNGTWITHFAKAVFVVDEWITIFATLLQLVHVISLVLLLPTSDSLVRGDLPEFGKFDASVRE